MVCIDIGEADEEHGACRELEYSFIIAHIFLINAGRFCADLDLYSAVRSISREVRSLTLRDFLVSLLLDFFDMYNKFDIGIECLQQGSSYVNLLVLFGPVEYSEKAVVIKLSLPLNFPGQAPIAALYLDPQKSKNLKD